jgi:hypothetical protein
MARLIDSAEVVTGVAYRALGVVDEACRDQMHTPGPVERWVQVARGMAFLQCASAVIEARVRVECWSTKPGSPEGAWSGVEEVEVVLPSGVLGVATVTGGWEEVPVVLPSGGLYGVRWSWAVNGARGPFYSPLPGDVAELSAPPGHEAGLEGVEQFCLVQVWRLSAEG